MLYTPEKYIKLIEQYMKAERLIVNELNEIKHLSLLDKILFKVQYLKKMENVTELDNIVLECHEFATYFIPFGKVTKATYDALVKKIYESGNKDYCIQTYMLDLYRFQHTRNDIDNFTLWINANYKRNANAFLEAFVRDYPGQDKTFAIAYRSYLKELDIKFSYLLTKIT